MTEDEPILPDIDLTNKKSDLEKEDGSDAEVASN